jgi:hypothetical protein
MNTRITLTSPTLNLTRQDPFPRPRQGPHCAMSTSSSNHSVLYGHYIDTASPWLSTPLRLPRYATGAVKQHPFTSYSGWHSNLDTSISSSSASSSFIASCFISIFSSLLLLPCFFFKSSHKGQSSTKKISRHLKQ